jgi:hypothetical protein
VSAINGFKTISIIANETDIEISVVKEDIQNLMYEEFKTISFLSLLFL